MGSSQHRAFRFLLCWFASYLVFFSIAATKLPNYVLPLYPAMAILTARLLTRWREGELALPKWVAASSIAGLVIVGLGLIVGLLAVGDAVKVLPRNSRMFPGLEWWAPIGLIPLAAATVMWLAARAADRARFVGAMAVSAVAFTGLVAAFPPLIIDERKAPKELVRASGVDDPSRDLRLAHCDWFQPSLVFYARRGVAEMTSVEMVGQFLATPTPAYMFIPASTWDRVGPSVRVPTRIVARKYDFLKNCEVIVVTNEVTATAAR